jgi:hypothetical protein
MLPHVHENENFGVCNLISFCRKSALNISETADAQTKHLRYHSRSLNNGSEQEGSLQNTEIGTLESFVQNSGISFMLERNFVRVLMNDI